MSCRIQAQATRKKKQEVAFLRTQKEVLAHALFLSFTVAHQNSWKLNSSAIASFTSVKSALFYFRGVSWRHSINSRLLELLKHTESQWIIFVTCLLRELCPLIFVTQVKNCACRNQELTTWSVASVIAELLFRMIFLRISTTKSLRNFKRRIDKWLSVSDSHTANM